MGQQREVVKATSLFNFYNMDTQKRTELEELGEFELIKRITSKFKPSNKSSLLGIGDDAAIIGSSEESAILVSTDSLIEGVHFNLTYVPLNLLGYKAVSVNVSDICAMNANPEQILISIAVSNRFSVEAVEELYSGIKEACEFYNIDLVGGDTTSSLSGLVINVTVLGRAKKEQITYRSGAKEYDLIVATGDLGSAYMGLQVLEREKVVFEENPSIQPDLDGHDYVIQRQLKPEARIDVVKQLNKLDIKPSSMIDISDGLASELIHICKSSKTGCVVYLDKIPIDTKTVSTAMDFNLDHNTCALNGGEDYELLFTINQSDFDKIKDHPHLTIIGHITSESEGMYIVDKNDSAIAIKAQGWKHFS